MTRRAATLVTTRGVDALEGTRAGVLATFVDICQGESRGVAGEDEGEK